MINDPVEEEINFMKFYNIALLYHDKFLAMVLVEANDYRVFNYDQVAWLFPFS